MTMSLTAFAEIAKRSVYPIMDEEYQAEPVLYPRLCEMVTQNLPIFGDKGTSMGGLGQPKERLDGEEVQADQIGEGYTWYAKIRLLSRRVEFSDRDLEHLDERRAASGLGDMMEKITRGWGTSFAAKSDQHCADMFQDGTLTAGNADLFDGSFKGETDPYPKFIYDGYPWFDTTHPRKFGSETYANHVVSAALGTTTLQDALIRMSTTNAVDERGEQILIQPSLLVVPPALRFKAQTLLRSVQLVGSSNNDVNTMYQALQPIEWRRLNKAASAAAWWIGQAGKGIRCYDSGAPIITTYEDPKRKVFGMVAEKRIGFAVTNWRYWECDNKAAS